jgi:hypothetical protein
VEGEGDQPRHGGFLPPEPPGPEPELAPPPAAQQQWAPPEGASQEPPPQPGWQPPPQQQPPPAYGQTWQTQQPDNGPAVTGFVLSMIGAGLLLFLLAPISLICAIFGIVYSRRGKRKVERGETTRSKGLAQAGFVSGIVVLALSVLITAIEILIVVLYASDDQFREDFQDEFEQELDDSQTVTAAIRLAAPAIRAAAGLLT